MGGSGTLEALGLHDRDEAFKRYWLDHGIPATSRGKEGQVTVARQSAFRRAEAREAWKGFSAANIGAQALRSKGETELAAEVLKTWYEGRRRAMAQKHGIQMKAMDEGVVGGNTVAGATPLVFDPDVLRILKQEAPVIERVPEEGQAGFKAVANRIDDRDAPIGFTSEADVLDLTNNTEADITFDQIEVDMEIWADLVSISDFSRVASQHYMDIRDLTLAERLAEHAQAKERAILYADNSQAIDSGDIGDADAYDGFRTIINAAGNLVDKSAVDISGTDALLKNIKQEIKAFLQGTNNVVKSELEVWVSHAMFDELENEMEVRARVNQDENSVNFGFESITISGIPVFATHSIDEHTDGAFTVGSEGDVFIMNRRSMRFRSLAPLSTIPLARRGLSEQVALFEFGAPILRGNGNLCKVLDAYPITSLTA